MKNVTFVDLFCGIGGMRLGFENAARRRRVNAECILSCDWNKFARQTYQANFLDLLPAAVDVRNVAADSIGGCDVLLAGFPCQPFSISGVSKKKSLGRPH